MDLYDFPKIGIPDESAGPTDFVPEPFPSGENQEGKTWSYRPSTRTMVFRHPKIFFGPGATYENVNLTTDVWVPIYGAIPADGVGFRAGMVAYVPRGRYGLFGQVAIATPSVNLVYHVRVRQGTVVSDPTNQPKIAVGSPITVGGGIQVCPTVSSVPFTIPFQASDIQYPGDPGYADQIWVEVYAEGTGASPGAVLDSSTVSTSTNISKFTIIRWDGQHGAS